MKTGKNQFSLVPRSSAGKSRPGRCSIASIFYSLVAFVLKILFCHSKIKSISSHHRVIFSLYFFIIIFLTLDFYYNCTFNACAYFERALVLLGVNVGTWIIDWFDWLVDLYLAVEGYSRQCHSNQIMEELKRCEQVLLPLLWRNF